jgi:hypothetical protein
MVFEIRLETSGAVKLSGGQLDSPLDYQPPDGMEMATRMVGFLSQKLGSELRVFDGDGRLVSTRSFEPMLPLDDRSMAKAMETGEIH